MSSSEPQKRAQLYGIGIGQGLLIILHEWSGCIGGCCAVQAIASGMWVCCGGGACQSAQQAEYMPLALVCTTHRPSMHPQYKTEGSLFLHFEVLRVALRNSKTLFLHISHTHLQSRPKKCYFHSPLEPFLSNYDIICRKLKHVPIHSIVRKRTKMKAK